MLCSWLAAVSVDVAMLTAFRFLMGLSCSVPTTVGGGFIADLMAPEERGKAYTMLVIGPLMVSSNTSIAQAAGPKADS